MPLGLSISSSAGGASDEHAARVPRGITNLGNTCFLNGSIQALLACEPVRPTIARHWHGLWARRRLRDLPLSPPLALVPSRAPFDDTPPTPPYSARSSL